MTYAVGDQDQYWDTIHTRPDVESTRPSHHIRLRKSCFTQAAFCGWSTDSCAHRQKGIPLKYRTTMQVCSGRRLALLRRRPGCRSLRKSILGAMSRSHLQTPVLCEHTRARRSRTTRGRGYTCSRWAGNFAISTLNISSALDKSGPIYLWWSRPSDGERTMTAKSSVSR